MYEFTLTANQKNQKLISFIFNSLKPHITNLGGIIVTDISFGKQNVCLAVDPSYCEQIKGVIGQVVAEAIVYYYKFDYLASSINLGITNSAAHNSFVQALVVFDKQTDKDIITSSLSLEHRLVVDSFYEFRLGALRERWEQIVSVVMESIPILLKDRSVDELTRYFVDSSGGNASEVNLYVDSCSVTVDIGEDKQPLTFDTTSDYQTDLVCEIISLSPKKIIIHGQASVAQSIEAALSSVFYGKIYIAN